MTDAVTHVPTPPAEAEVKLMIGADEVARQVVLELEIGGHPSGAIKVRLNYSEGEALKLAETLLLAAGRLQRLGPKPGLAVPKNGTVLKLPKR